MAHYNSKSSPADTAALITMVFLALIVLVLTGIYFLRQNGYLSSDTGIAENTLPHVIGTEPVLTASVSETVSSQEASSEKVSESTETTVSESDSETVSETEEIPGLNIIASTEYDAAFYDKVLMIGDSLSVGLVNYGYLKAENVFAQVGLTPASVMTTNINEESVYAKAAGLDPDYICIMLGTNGLSYLTEDYMAQKMGEFIDALGQICPGAEIVLVSIPPVTAAHELEKPEKLENISAYNGHIRNLAEEKSVIFVDTFSLLQDQTGYLAADYAEKDGLHFKTGAYPVILSAVQSAISEAFPAEEEQTSLVTSVPETAASSESVTSVSSSAVTTVTSVPQTVQSGSTTDIISITG